MMKEIKAEIVISATTEKVWAVLALFFERNPASAS